MNGVMQQEWLYKKALAASSCFRYFTMMPCKTHKLFQ